MDISQDEVARVAATIDRRDYSFVSLAQIRKLVDLHGGKKVVEELVRIEKTKERSEQDAVDGVNSSLEALELHDEFSALLLMAYLCRMAGPLCMHHVCDGTGLYFFHQMSDALRAKLLEMAEREVDENASTRYKKWAAYKSVK